MGGVPSRGGNRPQHGRLHTPLAGPFNPTLNDDPPPPPPPHVPIDLVDDRYPRAGRVVQAVPDRQVGVDKRHIVAQVGGDPVLDGALWVRLPHLLNAHRAHLRPLGADVGQRQRRRHPDIRRALRVKRKRHVLGRPRRRLRHPPVRAQLTLARADGGLQAGLQRRDAAVKVAGANDLHGAGLKRDAHVQGAGVEARVAGEVVGRLKRGERHRLGLFEPVLEVGGGVQRQRPPLERHGLGGGGARRRWF